MTTPRCRHERNSWVIGGRWEWCWRCGALRRLKQTGAAAYEADSGWARPTGPDGDNPWKKFNRKEQ